MHWEIGLIMWKFLKGSDKVEEKLLAVINQIKDSRKSNSSRNVEEFKIIFKYLAFVACAAKAPIRQKLLDETLKLIEKAGDAKNVQRWCLWTPSQLRFLK